MDRRIARVEVAPELLAKVLHFPDGTDIISAEVRRGVHGMAVSLVVEHSGLPAVDEDFPPEVWPIVQYHRESWDFDWNVTQLHDEIRTDDNSSEVS